LMECISFYLSDAFPSNFYSRDTFPRDSFKRQKKRQQKKQKIKYEILLSLCSIRMTKKVSDTNRYKKWSQSAWHFVIIFYRKVGDCFVAALRAKTFFCHCAPFLDSQKQVNGTKWSDVAVSVLWKKLLKTVKKLQKSVRF